MPVTFESEFERLLKELDITLEKIRVIHSDTSHLNSESKKYKDTLTEYSNLASDIFRFKNVWEEAKRGNDG
jgi:archaellum component FlaC